MAEERILIIKLKQKPCDTCNVIRGCAGSCILESKWYSSMTRQEVIEKMAVGMCRFDCNDIEKECCNCNEWEKYDKLETLAEAALNAIAPMITQGADNGGKN